MKKRRFGAGSDDGSIEDAEREAAAELARLTRQTRPPSGPVGGYTNLGDRPVPRPAPAGPSVSSTGRSRDRSASQPSFGSPLPVPSFAEPGADDEVEDDDPRSGVRAEEEALTEMALRDWAAQKKRDSRSFEDYALVGLDRVGAEAQRDRALRQAIDRQQRMASEIEARRAESAHNFPEAAQPLPSRPRGNANL
ncbi:MAG: hypothetical protein ACRDY5_03125, partial [Acidimicrobiales bacterium]